ncbi:MAG: hypothetical protein KME08_12870 [Aphanothece sp. CMT-3BRIN-NPC111]|jgi:hypothetical protein|nr:hypothetical protein [Aphanothece sp. CMT-3BRIN-NPC111]
MLTIVFGRLLVGSLNLQEVLGNRGLQWLHVIIGQQNEEEEEEILTSFEPTEDICTAEPQIQNAPAIQLSTDPRLSGCEFKIVRAKGNLFRDPAIFQQLCEEEAEAGWMLLEKLDDRRVRFKRPVALRDVINPEFLEFDPYRCYYGTSWMSLKLLGAIAAVLTLVVPAYLGYTFVSSLLAHVPGRSLELPSQQPPLREQPPTP